MGSLQPNELGLYGMRGNVLEWCSDWFDVYYYAGSPENNPAGPSTGVNKVNRGGSWRSTIPRTYVTFRFNDRPGIRSAGMGFRLAASE